jgi:peptidoglycan DL-endopeptidase CwlO
VATTSGTPSRARRTVARAAASVAVAALVFGGLIGVGSTAQAQPKATISQVEAQVEALQQDAADAAEQWDGAVTKLHAIQVKIASLNIRIKAAEAQYNAVAGAVNAMARAAYASGGIDPSLQALLADDPQAFLDQTASLDQVARAQGTSLRRTAAARLALAQLQVQLSQQKTAAAAASSDAKAAKLEVDQKLAAAEALLGSLKAAERQKLLAAIAAKRAHSEALARAAQQQAAREAASATKHRSSGGSGYSSGGGSSSYGGGSGGSPSTRARIAVAYALSKVGHGYVAGAAGPGVFDCSGLTMAAYRAAGISLPHYSYSQYDVTRRVSRGDLRPGDLVFYFGYGAHHVAMYIGGGMMVSASNPSAGVQIIGVWSAWYAERYSGGGRVV